MNPVKAIVLNAWAKIEPPNDNEILLPKSWGEENLIKAFKTVTKENVDSDSIFAFDSIMTFGTDKAKNYFWQLMLLAAIEDFSCFGLNFSQVTDDIISNTTSNYLTNDQIHATYNVLIYASYNHHGQMEKDELEALRIMHCRIIAQQDG